MSFQSFGFWIFLGLSLALCRLFSAFAEAGAGLKPSLRRAALRTFSLALVSLVFYILCCDGSGQALLPPAAGMLVSWSAAKYLQSGKPHRQAVFLLAAGWQVCVLLLYKYAAFFTGGRFSLSPVPPGISFFTFQQLWFLKEIYSGAFTLVPDRRGSFVLYSLFFPTVTSGPIWKPQAFFPQLEGKRADGSNFAPALYAISLGMAKKVLLADPLGTVVANGWALGADMTAPAAWVVILGYSLQLYLDFSGYCDIASGCARLFGIRVPVNFDSPYRALSAGEFWKRWHMTLTAFLRECVYIPLGGSRRGTARTCVNILIVYLISGFWHGAGWTFLAWGLLHGLAQVIERLWPGRERLPKALRWALTFLFVNLAWVFFQAPSLAAAGTLLRAAVRGGGGLPLEQLAAGALDSEATALRTLLPFAAKAVPGLVLAALFAIGLAVSLRRRSVVRRMEDFRPTLPRAAACGVLLAWAALSFSSTAAFIYSNF